jgi:hypothetical protein
MYLLFVLRRYIMLICVPVPCLITTPYWADFIVVTSMWGDDECTVWLVPPSKKGARVCDAIKATGYFSTTLQPHEQNLNIYLGPRERVLCLRNSALQTRFGKQFWNVKQQEGFCRIHESRQEHRPCGSCAHLRKWTHPIFYDDLRLIDNYAVPQEPQGIVDCKGREEIHV